MSKRKSPAGLESTLLSAIDHLDALTVEAHSQDEQPAFAPAHWVEAVEAVLQEAITIPVEYTRCALVMACCELGQLWAAWVNTPPEESSRAFAGWPPHEWFNQFDKIKKLVKSPATDRPEPVAELVRQKVAPAQIARIWGLVLPSGEADTKAILKEINEPGSVITDTFVPQYIRDRLRIAEQLQRDTADLLATLDAPRESEQPPEQLPCPESIEMLIEQKVPYKQIAAMHGVSMDEVKAIAEAMQASPAGA